MGYEDRSVAQGLDAPADAPAAATNEAANPGLAPPAPLNGENLVATGRVCGAKGGLLTIEIETPDGRRRIDAASLISIGAEETDLKVAVLFAGGAGAAPLVIGRLIEAGIDEPAADPHINGREQVTLRCGKASITLTAAGKVLIRGAYVSSRSTGVNRIKGGSVQIN
jgi:hypothetical protein